MTPVYRKRLESRLKKLLQKAKRDQEDLATLPAGTLWISGVLDEVGDTRHQIQSIRERLRK